MEPEQVMKITSLSISGPTYGIGHTSRQQALLESAKFEGWETSHLVIRELDPLLPQLNELFEATKDSKCLVIDLDPRFVEKHKLSLNTCLGGIPFDSVHKFVIDADSNFPIRNMLNTVQFKFAIHPYGSLGCKTNGKELSGFGYSIFSRTLQYVRNTKSYSTIDEQNILVTCGGSDPENISSFFLRALDEFSDSKLNIKLVIGRFFSAAQIEKVQFQAKSISHQVEILDSPLSLDEALAFSDISFVTGGLTRNESMFSGVCTVVADINQEQFESTSLFASRDAVVSLGLLKSDGSGREEQAAVEQIRSILGNRERQKILIENAKVCFPENGASRVLAEIGDVCLKQT
jgi:spore coat polysaccharide biosynthesis predicted glycosyltransferase SpsG